MNATAIDWGVVVVLLTAAGTIFVKWLLPAIMTYRKGDGNGHGQRISRTEFELGRIEQILTGRSAMFETMVSDQRRIAEEQVRIAALLQRVENIVNELEERGRGQDKAIEAVLKQAALRELEPTRTRRGR